MKVITMSDRELAEACRRLAEACRDAGTMPDCIVGIRRGGWIVARKMASCFPDASLLPVALQRPSTGRKTDVVKTMIRRLPRFLQNWLRILESRLLSAFDDGKIPLDVFELSEEMATQLAEECPETVLIVDDAIDSGKTMWMVAEGVRRVLPSAKVKTAVITVTTKKPLIVPDFSLYNNRTLIRFPWAIDA